MSSPTSAGIAISAVLSIAIGAIVPAHANANCKTTYSITDMGSLGGEAAYPSGLNDRGEAVGYSFRDSDFTPRAFVWSRKYGMRELKDLSSSGGSFASDISARGDIAGVSGTANGDFHAALWRRKHGRPLDLGTLTPQGQRSVARSVNAWGHVVGSSDTSINGDFRAFLWSPFSQTLQDLGSLENNTTSSSASAISNLGHIVGLSYIGDGEHAVLWMPWTHRIRDLGTLGSDHSYAEAVNERGDVAGESSIAFDPVSQTTFTHAFFWSRGRMYDLGTLGGDDSYASGINNRRQVVGTSQIPPAPDEVLGAYHAFLWSKDCGIQDLNDLISPAYGIVLSSAADINNRQQIAAEGDVGDWTHSFLLTPIEGNCVAADQSETSCWQP